MDDAKTLLAAAKIVDPEESWGNSFGRIHNGGGRTFNPLTNPADAYTLQIALEKASWEFRYSEHTGNFHAEKIVPVNQAVFMVDAPTKPELLLKCVETLEAMK